MSIKTMYRVNGTAKPGNGKNGSSPYSPRPRKFPTPEFLGRLRSGIDLLWSSFQCAHSVDGKVWEFAVEVASLRASGLADNDLRWLVLKEYVDHAREVTRKDDDCRRFRRTGSLCFVKRTCFILTSAGARFARGDFDEELIHSFVTLVGSNGQQQKVKAQDVPTWDADDRELQFGGRVIKRFRRCAENQEKILASFQEEGWPHRIDDPIPPKPDQNQRQRLRDAISSLNKHQHNKLIRFRGDGTGRGIVWEANL